MKYTILCLFAAITSCTRTEKPFDVTLREIPYKTKDDYRDSLFQKIIPISNYDYWAYIVVESGRSTAESPFVHTVVYERGDTLLKQTHNIRINRDDIGFFAGCHPLWCVRYITGISNEGLSSVTTEKSLLDFIGPVDNLEEAMLVAMINGYRIDHDARGRLYTKTNDGFEMHLVKYTEYPLQKEFFKVSVHKNQKVDVESLGIVVKGRDALK